MKRYLSLIIIIALISFPLIACADKTPSEPDPSEPGTTEDIDYSEEDDEYEIQKKESAASDYFGTWIATSDKAEYLYGNVEITVNEDKSWTANITGLDLDGDWEDNGDSLHMNNELFSFDLAFSESGNLILIETNNGDEITTVLSRK